MKHELLYHDNDITVVGYIDQTPIAVKQNTEEGAIIPHRQHVGQVKLFAERRTYEGELISTTSLHIPVSAIISIAKHIQFIEESTIDAPYYSNLPY